MRQLVQTRFRAIDVEHEERHARPTLNAKKNLSCLEGDVAQDAAVSRYRFLSTGGKHFHQPLCAFRFLKRTV
jgi:hypothetical protein